MRLLDNLIYKEKIKENSNMNIPWENLKNKSIMLTGATGLIGSYLIDLIMYNNINKNLNCKIIALGRSAEKAKERFYEYWNLNQFEFIKFDLNNVNELEYLNKVNYIIHLASNTHPQLYALDPIGTITTNIIGTYNLLEFAYKKEIDRFVFISSCEIYGENIGNTEKFNEEYLGYINCNTLRAGYPEAKRCGESLCQAFIAQKNMNIVIPRLARIYGPTMLMNDSKAISQFIKNAINSKDIVLKSEGNQYYSYLYVADAVYGILQIMLLGKNGEAYNVSDDKSDITLKNLAKIIAEHTESKVIFEKPDEIEKIGYSKATKARLDNSKLLKLNCKFKYSLSEGIVETIKILKME